MRIKNISGSEGTWVGQTIADGAYYTIQSAERNEWLDDSQVFADVASGNLLVNDGSDDITDPAEGWRVLQKYQKMPLSPSLGNKLAVHQSTKPDIPGVTTYAVWAGNGDDIDQADATNSLGEGELLGFSMTPGTATVTRSAKFDPRHGRVWIHEAYMKFEGAGMGDYLTADIVVPGTPLQTAQDLDYTVVDNWVHYAGPGAGTHGLAGTPSLVPRTYSRDGHWDFDGVNLTPNMAGEGLYKMTTISRSVHRFFNKLVCCGTSPYFSMTSEETFEMRVDLGHFIEIKVHNTSDTTWTLSVLMELFRQRTVVP